MSLMFYIELDWYNGIFYEVLSECPNDFPGCMRSRMRCFYEVMPFWDLSSTKNFRKQHTKSLSSGKPPSIFRSHTSTGSDSDVLVDAVVSFDVGATCNHTRKQPAVSGSTSGIKCIPRSKGGANVMSSSVETQLARWSLGLFEFRHVNLKTSDGRSIHMSEQNSYQRHWMY